MRRERDRRTSVLKKVEENDRQYVFNSGKEELGAANEINESSIHNVKKASSFIADLAEGNYQVGWEGLTDENHLRLASCYAFNRKKFIQKRVDIGEGLADRRISKVKLLR